MIKKLEKITDISHIFMDIEKDMKPPKKDLIDGRASGRESKMSGDGDKVKKVEIPFTSFTGCLRYLFVKGPEKLEDKAN
jgi:hypothetical protein